jgi:hypothetical protein
MPIYEQANVLFEKLRNDQPLVLEQANTGAGAVLANPTATATPAPTATQSASATPGASANPSASPTSSALPEWARGTNASIETCSG